MLAIEQAPTPKTVEQLESFLGMINYYGKFIPNLSTIAAPLNQLWHKNKSWTWGNQEEAAFKLLKEELVSTKILVHYNPTLPVKLDCDASSVGIGAVFQERRKQFYIGQANSGHYIFEHVEKEPPVDTQSVAIV